jgi:uncharacterized zinc-type alcohol dehydrogenase-like protein
MINAFAAFEPRGELQLFEYDPGELKAHEVEMMFTPLVFAIVI